MSAEGPRRNDEVVRARIEDNVGAAFVPYDGRYETQFVSARAELAVALPPCRHNTGVVHTNDLHRVCTTVGGVTR
jgi:hypothetical protein